MMQIGRGGFGYVGIPYEAWTDLFNEENTPMEHRPHDRMVYATIDIAVMELRAKRKEAEEFK